MVMVIDPGDQDDAKAQNKSENGGENMVKRMPESGGIMDLGCCRNFYIDDQQCDGDGKDAVAKSFQPCGSMRF